MPVAPRHMLVALGLSAALAGCQPSSSPSVPGPPTIDSVMRLPSSGTPIMIPQSLGGEYRALPEVSEAARGVAIDLRDVTDPSRVELFIDGAAVARGDTSGTLIAGEAPRFSVASDSFGARLAVLLPLSPGAARPRMTLSVAGGTGGARRSAIVDTPSASRASRPEPSDLFFQPGSKGDYWGQPIYSGVLESRYIVARDVLLGGWLLSHGGPFDFNADGTLPATTPMAPHRNCLRETGGGHYCEDIHYYLMLDPTFLARVYGRTDRVSPLSNARLPGSSAHGDPDPLPPAATESLGGVPGAPNAVTINSFNLRLGTCGFHALPDDEPWRSLACLKGEQPVWHVTTTPPTGPGYFGAHVNGLGAPPVLWTRFPTHPAYDTETWYAYNPRTGIDLTSRAEPSRALVFGDYVIVKATLYQDAPHGYPPPSCFPRSIWHDGWLEFHSIDWIAQAPRPARASTAAQIADCEHKGRAPKVIDAEVGPPPAWLLPRGAGDTLHYCVLVDDRFSTPGYFSGFQVSAGAQPDKLRVRATLNPTATQDAALTLSVVMWWAPASDATLDAACYGSPSS